MRLVMVLNLRGITALFIGTYSLKSKREYFLYFHSTDTAPRKS